GILADGCGAEPLVHVSRTAQQRDDVNSQTRRAEKSNSTEHAETSADAIGNGKCPRELLRVRQLAQLAARLPGHGDDELAGFRRVVVELLDRSEKQTKRRCGLECAARFADDDDAPA